MAIISGLMLSAQLCPKRGFVVAESLLSWLGASVETSWCQAQASFSSPSAFKFQLGMCMVIILACLEVELDQRSYQLSSLEMSAQNARRDQMLFITPV